MAKKLLRRWLPKRHQLSTHRSLRGLGARLEHPNLWHLNRQSVSKGAALGLFIAFIPVPFQMPLAAFMAFWLRVNLPISVMCVWFSNPLTMPPLFLFAYRLGAWCLGIHPGPFRFELSMDWLTTGLLAIWKPFLLGCFICGVVCSIVGYFSIKIIWRISVTRLWRARKLRRLLRRQWDNQN